MANDKWQEVQNFLHFLANIFAFPGWGKMGKWSY